MGETNANPRGSNFTRNVCIGLFSIFLILALLPRTKHFADWKETSNSAENQLSRSPFFVAHVFNPSTDGLHFTSWRATDWRNWLHRRDLAHQRASPKPPKRRRPLFEKGLNSIIIASLLQFQNGFEAHADNRAQYLWSSVRFSSFVFRKNNHGVLTVYHCPPMYFRVKFENGKPVHLDGHSHNKNNAKWNNDGKVNPGKDCEEVL